MYHEDFKSVEHMLESFEITSEHLRGVEILFAVYRTGCYDGTSIVLFKKDDKFYIVDAGHCSCYGLEGQWDPVETSPEVLKMEIEAKSNYKYEEFESFIEFCRDYFNWEKK